jgi:23S rRNA pseudouridine2605 synthase
MKPHDKPRPTGVRLQRLLAEAGVAARRQCEQLIADGRVSVNGQVVTHLPVFVDPRHDRIAVDSTIITKGTRNRPAPVQNDRELDAAPDSGSEIIDDESDTGDDDVDFESAAQALGVRKRYLLVNKPPRVMTTTKDPGERTTIMDLVQHPFAERLYPVGRLEYNHAGLVLVTNDGALANRLSHPRFGVPRVYHVMVKQVLDAAFVADLERGLRAKMIRFARNTNSRSGRLDLRLLAVPRASDDRALDKTLLEVTLTPGKHQSIDDLFAEAGIKVTRVVQVGLGPLTLKGVAPANWRELDRYEMQALRKALSGKPTSEQRRPRPNRPAPETAAGAGAPRAPRAAGPKQLGPRPRRNDPPRRDGGPSGPRPSRNGPAPRQGQGVRKPGPRR